MCTRRRPPRAKKAGRAIWYPERVHIDALFAGASRQSLAPLHRTRHGRFHVNNSSCRPLFELKVCMEDLGLLWIPAGFALIFFFVAALFLTI